MREKILKTLVVLSLISGAFLTRDIAQHMSLDLLSILFGAIIFLTTTAISFCTLGFVAIVVLFIAMIL